MDDTSTAADGIHFIKDVTADADEFGSHTRIANAIAEVIRSRPELKVVGLVGPWGSGKSTVLRLAEATLGAAKGPDGAHWFQYDAWLHQNDPPRRSFLETLIHFLISRDLPERNSNCWLRWKRRLDQLNRRVEETETTTTPSFTISGRLIIWSLLLVPIAAQFSGYQAMKGVFAHDATSLERASFWLASFLLLLPFVIGTFVYFSWRPRTSMFSKEFWCKHRSPYEDESILSLITNKQVQTVRNRTRKDPEPSTIEFQDFFREIMGAVATPERRFIFVIDNLDRLPEAEAVAMWGTIRSFFLGAQETEFVRKAVAQPTVILPVDENAVKRMYQISHKDDADRLAKSFIDKTFDLTFRVTRPVLSDWQAYLGKQLGFVFGKNLDPEWTHIVGVFYERWLTQQEGQVVTPRIINTLINSLAVLWLQWRSEKISFAAISYYAIFRESIERDIIQAFSTPLARIDDFDPDWQQSIAALHYGVPPSDAMQVLMEQPLQQAIGKSDIERVNELAALKGFERVFQRILDGGIAAQPDPTFVLNCALLLGKTKIAAGVWITEVWRRLGAALNRIPALKAIRSQDVDAFTEMLSHAQNRVALADAVIRTLGRVEEGAFNSPTGTKSFVKILVEATRILGANVESEIRVPGGAPVFLAVLAAASDYPELLPRLISDASDAQVVQQITAELTDPSKSVACEFRGRAFIRRGRKVDWNALIVAAGQVVEGQPATYPGMAAALSILGLFRNTEKAARAEIKRLLDGGILANRLNEASSSKLDDVTARIAALYLSEGANLPNPGGTTWDKAIEARSELAAKIDLALSDITPDIGLGPLMSLVVANPSAKPLVRVVGLIRLQQGRVGAIDAKHAVSNLPAYYDCFDGDPGQGLILTQIVNADGFWDTLTARGLDANSIALLRKLAQSSGDNRDRAIEIINRKLAEVAASAWSAVIKSGTEPYALAAEVGASIGGGAQLFEALQGLIEPLVSEPDGAIRSRWYKASSFLSLSARHTLYRNLRDRITGGAQTNDLPGLLSLLGAEYLGAAGFGEEPDEAVRHVVIPLLSNKAGIDWLLTVSGIVGKWVDGSKETTRQFLAERIRHLLEAGGATEELTSMRAQWNLADVAGATEAVSAEPDERPEIDR